MRDRKDVFPHFFFTNAGTDNDKYFDVDSSPNILSYPPYSATLQKFSEHLLFLN